MTHSRSGVCRLGAAAFAVGLGLVGPAALAGADPAGEATGPGSDGDRAARHEAEAPRPAARAADPDRVHRTTRVDADSSRPALPDPAAATGPDARSPDPAARDRAAAVSEQPGPARRATHPGPERRSTLRTPAPDAPDPLRRQAVQDVAPARTEPVSRPAPAPAAAVEEVVPAPAAALAPPPVPAGAPAAAIGSEADLGQGIATAVNRVFNSAFEWLSTLPGGPVSGFLEGALVLIRRTLFGLVPTGVGAQRVGTSLNISVNTGSVAYFRNDDSGIAVSGDPWFLGAPRFAGATVAEVLVGNPGSPGGAGFVFTGQPVDAGLTTTGIDAIRFGAGAAFTGMVSVGLTGATLTVTDAIRGLGGVDISAPVRLANDVEIDAGEKNARFRGTVDATRDGRQSLTVTALGATTFDAAVGGHTALANLTTRALAPLVITQSGDSRTIPLHYMPEYSVNGGPQVKYGIDVAIGDNPSQIYEFDTGGVGFFAGYNSPFWQGVPLSDEALQANYTSGNFYDAVVSRTPITIGRGAQTVSTQPIAIAAILSGGNTKTGQIFDFTNPDAPPVDGRFFGDFGASFGVRSLDGESQLMASPLFQLPGNLSSGFLAQLGPIGVTPHLTVGVTDALRAQFTYAIPVGALVGGSYPVSGYPLLQAFGFAGQYSVTGPDGKLVLGNEDFPQCLQQCLPSLIDSGAPSTSVRLPGITPPYPYEQDGGLTPGTVFTATFPTTAGRPQLTWQFVAGENGSVNEVNYSTAGGAAESSQNVNTGLNLYNAFDVMFDVASQVIWLRPNGGQSTVSLQSVTTTGAQNYAQNATLDGNYSAGGDFTVAGVTTLAGDTVVDTTRGDVTFAGTVDGRHSLEVESGGAISFVRTVGGQRSLTNLRTEAAGRTSTASVLTRDSQDYRGNVSLNGLYTTDTGAFGVTGATLLTGPAEIDAAGRITFGGRVESLSGKGFPLSVSSGDEVSFGSAVGGTDTPLGGLQISGATTVAAAGPVRLDGSLGYGADTGLSIGDSVTVRFTAGGTITGFSGSGVEFRGTSRNSELRGFTISDNVYDGIQIAADGRGLPGPVDYSGTVLAGNTIFGNSAFGIETSAPVLGLTIRDNTIGRPGTANPWGYTTGGPNAHGIVLAPGLYTGSAISGNTIAHNRRSGVMAPGGVQGLLISDNTVERNDGNGVEFATGDFTGTVVTGNAIRDNGGDGISLGAGIGQGEAAGGNPLGGYTADSGHYILGYANSPDFYDPANTVADPQISMTVGSMPSSLVVNLDTGSRGLYFDKLQLGSDATPGEADPPGYVYLNSSNRLYFGRWTNQRITFDDSVYVGPEGNPVPGRKAVAEVPVLAVSAVGASDTPPPGSNLAITTFGTTVADGFITITDGSQTRTVPISPNTTGTGPAGSFTMPGGWWAAYDDNMIGDTGRSKLAPVANFGVGFDRSGQGTSPTGNDRNQVYNAFLNLTEMRDGGMRPGYIIGSDYVQLGLDDSVFGFAYTDLAPTGLARGGQAAPDWQPATGTVRYQGIDYATGPLVIDMGIPSAILTLPGQKPSATFSGEMTVDLLNSGGSVGYGFRTDQAGAIAQTNLMAPTTVAFFNPLAGDYTQNMAPQSGQFFNTGRRVFSAFDYLYDAAGGYLGLAVGTSAEAQSAFASGNGEFTAAYYANPAAPTGVTNLTVGANTLSGNGGNGVTVNGAGSAGNAILSNAIFGNADGIVLGGGANGGQPAPEDVVATYRSSSGEITVDARVRAAGGYTGQFLVQVFASPAADASNVQGRRLLGSLNTGPGEFTARFAAGATSTGDWITVTATPVSAPQNTSQFSAAARVIVS